MAGEWRPACWCMHIGIVWFVFIVNAELCPVVPTVEIASTCSGCVCSSVLLVCALTLLLQPVALVLAISVTATVDKAGDAWRLCRLAVAQKLSRPCALELLQMMLK
jgi:hypothetical protein